MHPPRSSMLGLICVMLILTFSSPATASTTKHLTQMQWREKVVAQLELFAKFGSNIYEGEHQGNGGLFGKGCVGIVKIYARGSTKLLTNPVVEFSLLILYDNWFTEALNVGKYCVAFELEPNSKKSVRLKDLTTVSIDLEKARVAGNQLWQAVVK